MTKLFFYVVIMTCMINAFTNEKVPFFSPPKNWTLINPKTYTTYIKAAFTENEKKICRPTINLSIQETDLTTDEYTQEAKRAHEIDPNITYTILGKMNLKDGIANLSEVTKTVHSIDYKILQLILVQDNNAYILTAACRKEEVLHHYTTFIDSFKSFELIDDLFSKVSQESNKNILIKKYNAFVYSSKKNNAKQNKKNLLAFEKYLDKNHQNEGKYFSMLLIKKALKEIKDF